MDPGWFRQPLMAGTDRGEILLDNGFGRASALGLVAQKAADEADVCGGVDKDPNVEQGRQGRGAQQVRAFDHHHLSGRHRLAARLASVVNEGIKRSGHAASGLQVAQIGNQQIVITRGDIVEIVRRRIKTGDGSRVEIIGIFSQKGGDALGQRGNQGLGEGALAGARAAGDGDQNGHERLIHLEGARCKP
ncbi:hypothetical protein D3C73_1105210 [compost metagenome]